MMDCNQKWEVSEAIDWMKQLAEFKPFWIEEPTSPDDILGHATIAKVCVCVCGSFNFERVLPTYVLHSNHFTAGTEFIRNRGSHR